MNTMNGTGPLHHGQSKHQKRRNKGGATSDYNKREKMLAAKLIICHCQALRYMALPQVFVMILVSLFQCIHIIRVFKLKEVVGASE